MQLRTELEILASPLEIWDILVDFARYPEWNAFIVSASGELRVGATLKVCIALPEDGATRTFHPVVTECTSPFRLAWRGQLGFPWIFSGHHFFELLPLAEGRTRLVHAEDFSGLLTKFLGRTFTLTGRGFAYMNQALKRRAELAAIGKKRGVPPDYDSSAQPER